MAIGDGEGAIVGTLIRRSSGGPSSKQVLGPTTRFVFLVEWVIKGDVDRKISVLSSDLTGSCGIGPVVPLGARVGLVLGRDGGNWTSWIGWVFEPEELLNAGTNPRYLGPVGYFDRAQAAWERTFLYFLAFLPVIVLLMYFKRGRLRSPRHAEAEPVKWTLGRIEGR